LKSEGTDETSMPDERWGGALIEIRGTRNLVEIWFVRKNNRLRRKHVQGTSA